jgi:hypothetical protein
MSAAEPPTPPRSPSLPFPLQDGERVLKICRRHWIYFWPMLIGMFLAAVVPLVLVALQGDE